MKNGINKLVAIAAITKDRGIGKDNKLIVNNPLDMKHFKEVTSGNVVVMGFNTFKSLGFMPLDNRYNIVVTSQLSLILEEFKSKGIEVPSNLLITSDIDLIPFLKLDCEYSDKPFYIIGGKEIYDYFKDTVDKHILTVFDVVFPADRFYPIIDETIYNKCRTKVLDANTLIKTYETY